MEKLVKIDVSTALNYFFTIMNSNAELMSGLLRGLTREQQERFLCELFIKKLIIILNSAVGIKRIELSDDKKKLSLFIEIKLNKHTADEGNKTSHPIEIKIAEFDNINFSLDNREISFSLKILPESEQKDAESYMKKLEGEKYVLNRTSKMRIENLLSEKYWEKTIPKELYVGDGKTYSKEKKKMVSDFIEILSNHGITNVRGEALNYINKVLPKAEEIFPLFNDLTEDKKAEIVKNACNIKNLSDEESIDQYILARVLVNEIIKENLHAQVIIARTEYALAQTFYNYDKSIKFFYYDYPVKGGLTLQKSFDPFVFCQNITSGGKMDEEDEFA